MPEETCWDGSVNNIPDECVWTDESETDDCSFADSDSESVISAVEAEGEVLSKGLEKQLEIESTLLTAHKRYLKATVSRKEWKRAEAKRGFGYNGLSERTKRFHSQLAREKENRDAGIRKR